MRLFFLLVLLQSSASSSLEVTDDEHRTGRVVDASTGRPVVGATIETWTEELSPTGLYRVAAADSDANGAFRVSIRDGDVRAQKVRVVAPGHLTYPGTLDDLELVHLMPKPAWTWRVRVVDLADRPIRGARITTTYSCAHDVPAFEVTTGPEGVADLPEYGLQEHVGDLRVRAPGFATRKYVHWSEVPADPVNGEAAVIRLARQRGLRARLLTRDGKPLANGVVHVLDGEGHHVVATDCEGAFSIDASYEARDVVIEVFQGEERKHVFAGSLPPDGEVPLRVGAADWPPGTPVGTLRLSAAAGTPSVQLFHPGGWARSTELRAGDGRELEFPAGRISILVGGPFEGFTPAMLEVDLAAEETLALTLVPEPEAELTVLTHPGEARRIVVQAGERSISVESAERRVVSVPSGVEVTVLTEGDVSRRLALPPLVDKGTADLRGAELAPPRTRAQRVADAPRETIDVEIEGAEGGVLTAIGPGKPEVTRTGPNTFALDVPSGSPVAVRFAADGFATCWAATHSLQGRIVLRPSRSVPD